MRFSSTPSRTLAYDIAFAPFGEPYASTHVGNVFAGMEQVVAADEYQTPFREYHTGQGRWISPDPAGLSAVDPTNPQSWNRYAYVVNNPLGNVDPLGLDCVILQGDSAWNAVQSLHSVELGACSGKDPDNEYYVDGTVSNVYVDANNNVVATVNGKLTCAGDSGCSIYDNLTTTTVNGATASQIALLLSPSEIASDVINRPITTATISNVPNGKEEYCQARSNDAAKEAVLPGLTTPQGRKNAAKVAAHYGVAVAAGSYGLRYAVRKATRIPMSITQGVLEGLGDLALVYTGYEALRAAQEEYKACMIE